MNRSSSIVSAVWFFLVTSAVIYGGFSSPTPDDIETPEILLMTSLAMMSLLCLLHNPGNVLTSSYLWGFIAVDFLYCLVAWFRGNAAGDIFRDFASFTLYAIPILLWESGLLRQRSARIFTLLFLLISGFSFAINHISQESISPANLLSVKYGAGIDYIAMDVSLVFTAVFFISYSILLLCCADKIGAPLLFSSLALPVVVSVVALNTRAQMAVLFLSFVFSLFLVSFKFRGDRFKSMVLWGGMLLLLLFIGIGWIGDFLERSAQKTSQTNFWNNRDMELYAVFGMLYDDMALLVSGTGHGGLIAANAANDVGGRFTHNIYLYFLLKFGVVGLVAIIFMSYKCYKGMMRSFAIALATTDFLGVSIIMGSAAILLLNTLVEPGFKYLSFSMTLALVVSQVTYNASEKKRD